MNNAEILSSLFKVDKTRDLLVPDRRFCRLNLSPVVEATKNDMLSSGIEDFTTLPNWSKVSKFPNKAKSFLTTFFQAVGPGVVSHAVLLDSLNVDYQLEAAGQDPRHRYHCQETGNSILVEMMFFSGSISNAHLGDMGKIYQSAVPGTTVIVMCGDGGKKEAKINGKKFTNENAQKQVLATIKKSAKRGQNVMILAARIGARSFSIPSLSTVYLCYDNGQVGATRQKLSRAFTADTVEKIGYVISCSFDPNRDDKISPEILTAVKNSREKYPHLSAKDLLKYIIRTNGLMWDFTDGGMIQTDPDEWIDRAHENGMIKRTLGAVQNIVNMDDNLLLKWAAAVGYKSPNDTKESVDKGNTYSENKPPRDKSDKDEEDEDTDTKEKNDVLTKARASITLFLDKFHIIRSGTNSETVEQVLDNLKNNQNHQKFIKVYFGIDYDTLEETISQGGLNKTALELSLT